MSRFWFSSLSFLPIVRPAPSTPSRRVHGLILALLALGLTSCSALKKDEDTFDLDPTATAATSYNEGLEFMKLGSFTSAAKSFSSVEQNFPYADSAKSALIMGAYANFKAGNHPDSIGSAERYISLYPAGDDVDYALYLIGENNFVQIKDIKRDQSFAKEARKYFDEVVRRFPDSRYAAPAREKADQAHDQLAGKEMDIGRYYLRNNDYIAAINRFKVVVVDFQTTRHVEEALYRLTEANLSLGIAGEAQTAAAVLGYNYPESEWYDRAYRLLASNKLLPQANDKSWLLAVKTKNRS